MKKKIKCVILVVIILGAYLLVGCGTRKSLQKKFILDIKNATEENSLIENKGTEEKEIESDSVQQIEPIIWYSDLTHDGVDEKVVVDLTYVLNNSQTGEEQTVAVYSGSTGSLIWTGHADTVHVNWNGFYIYKDGEYDYLLIWQPSIYQDRAYFELQIFSLSEEGKVQELTTDTIEFNMLEPENCDINAITSYVSQVNEYLKNSYVLVDTDDANPIYSTPNNKISNCYDINGSYQIIKEIKENKN